MSDRVLVELSEDVVSTDVHGDEVTLWAAGQQVWLDPISAKSFMKNRGAKAVDTEPEPELVASDLVDRRVDPKKAPAAPAGGV